MTKRYEPKVIEPKWRQKWEDDELYKADLASDKPKYLAMSMFNYPSGAGIHIGHTMNYTISDVKARFKRQAGYESYHPIGWDAFGLPAENYAIKAGVSPQESMARIIPGYHEQYKAMGWSNDWSKEIATHEPAYYKWTQWIFAEMYKQGLAYQDARMQWWCDQCQTVLANEQIVDGKCWRHDGPDDPEVTQKEVKQWFFKITEYADELLEAIDDLDWTDSVKLAQKNWIGRSKGAEILFKIYEENITPDAPGSDEHKESASNGASGTDEYREPSNAEDDVVIAESAGSISGSARKQASTASSVRVFTTRPDTLFGATFMVLAPEHDLVSKITTDAQREEVDTYVAETQRKTEVDRLAAKEKTGVFTGAYAINPINDEKVPIWIADYVLTGYGTGAIMAVPAHDERDYEFAKKYELKILRVIQNDVKDDECTPDEGVMINSGEYDEMNSADAREKIVADLKTKGLADDKVNYKMRDWSVSRQRYWGAPIPIIYCEKDGTVLDENLPVTLPELDDFQPSGDGRSALARATDWLNVDCPKCGGKAQRETDTLDTYICSSWYFLRYLDPHNENQAFSKDLADKWMPADFYNGGDHATAHMLYARFVTRFFAKQGLLSEPEPFKQFLFNGKVRASDGSPFSKSKGNGVDPLEIIDQGYGADALRTYLMFAAPLEFNANWDPQGVPGTYRFLNRLFTLVQEYSETSDIELDEKTGKEVRLATHSMIKKVSEDIEENRYNTAISALMKCVNDLYKLKTVQFGKCEDWAEALHATVACVAPFAPHIAEELWHDLGNEVTVHKGSWPVHNPKYLTGDQINIVVQVNGKLRANIMVDSNASEEEVIKTAKSDASTSTHLEGQNIKREIYVPGKLVNFVI